MQRRVSQRARRSAATPAASAELLSHNLRSRDHDASAHAPEPAPAGRGQGRDGSGSQWHSESQSQSSPWWRDVGVRRFLLVAALSTLILYFLTSPIRTSVWQRQEARSRREAGYLLEGAVPRLVGAPHVAFAADFSSRQPLAPAVLQRTVADTWPARRLWTPHYLARHAPALIRNVYVKRRRAPPAPSEHAPSSAPLRHAHEFGTHVFGPIWTAPKPLSALPSVRWQNPHELRDFTSADFFARLSRGADATGAPNAHAGRGRDGDGDGDGGAEASAESESESESEYVYLSGNLDDLGARLSADVHPLGELLLTPKQSQVNVWIGQKGVLTHLHCKLPVFLVVFTDMSAVVWWCGVVRCGVVWCGVVWRGVVWCGVAWRGVVWCGVVGCGVVGVVWCGVVWCGVVWCGAVWCGVVWCGVVWCGVVWCGVVGVVWCGVVWQTTRTTTSTCSSMDASASCCFPPSSGPTYRSSLSSTRATPRLRQTSPFRAETRDFLLCSMPMQWRQVCISSSLSLFLCFQFYSSVSPVTTRFLVPIVRLDRGSSGCPLWFSDRLTLVRCESLGCAGARRSAVPAAAVVPYGRGAGRQYLRERLEHVQPVRVSRAGQHWALWSLPSPPPLSYYATCIAHWLVGRTLPGVWNSILKIRTCFCSGLVWCVLLLWWW